MKALQRVSACLAAFSMILILLVTATEAAIYADYNFYEKEYAKYHVLDDLDMEMEDVMEVTREMMSYLHGNRADLVVYTTVGGEEREFFNDREKAHMVDVKRLFQAGIAARYFAIGLFLVSGVVLLLTKGSWKKRISYFYMIEEGVLLLLAAGLGYLFTQDFNKYFFKFHEIFFDNDLWLLDTNTDLMIRMLPESFFRILQCESAHLPA